jgi:CRP-like cAMP-binding protein
MIEIDLGGLSVPLFEGLDSDGLRKLLNCLNASVIRKEKGGVLLREQCETSGVGVLLEGELTATRLDPSGKRFMVAHHCAGSVYGDILSLNPENKSPVTITAFTDVAVLTLPFEGILNRCGRNCACHETLRRNLLRTASLKYFELFDRLACVLRPTLREKLLFYFERTANKTGARTFNIPFDRAALAEYLNAERSALSRELSSMKRDGFIDYYKNTFKLL